MAAEKRDAFRIPVLGELHGDITIVQAVTVTEIGLGGAMLETSFPLQLNSLHDVRLELEQPVIVKSRVVHSSIIDVDQDVVRYRSGVEFVDPSPPVVSALARFLDRVTGGREP